MWRCQDQYLRKVCGCDNMLRYCNFVGRSLVSLPLITTDFLISFWKETSKERLYRHENGPCYERYVLLTFGTPLLLVIIIISFIFALFGLILYLPTYKLRETTCLITQESEKFRVKSSINPAPEPSIHLLTANTCLMPNFIAKFNNLSQTSKRATQIGHALTHHHSSPCNDCQPREDNSSIRMGRIASVLDRLPDFICLQEVFANSAKSNLLHVLKSKYPYIITRADSTRLFKFLDSGLFIASRYPILDSQFISFSRSGSEDSLADKGLLSVKVDLSSLYTDDGSSIVIGFIFITHLQAKQGAAYDTIRQSQLSQLYEGIQMFKEKTTPSVRIVLDILCGDFNMVLSQDTEHKIMREYADICSHVQWKDNYRPIGTELIQSDIYNADLCTPEEMQRAMCSGEGNSSLEHESQLCSADRRDCNGISCRRQIDYILIRKSLLNNLQISVENYDYFTGLAGLTDHIPLHVKIKLT